MWSGRLATNVGRMASRSTTAKRGSSRKRVTPAKPAPRPPARKSGSGTTGKAVRGGWNLLAKGVGSLARTLGRTKELDPAHRRDGLAFGLIAFAVVIGAAVWWHAAGPIGRGVEIAVRTVMGAGAVAFPLVLVVIGVALMRSDPRPEVRPRLVI